MPFDALPQLERDLLLVGAPGPAFGQIRHDRVQAVARLALVEQHEIVEYRHERIDRRDCRLLMDRGGRRIVAMIIFERSPLLLRWRRYAREHRDSQGHGKE